MHKIKRARQRHTDRQIDMSKNYTAFRKKSDKVGSGSKLISVVWRADHKDTPQTSCCGIHGEACHAYDSALVLLV